MKSYTTYFPELHICINKMQTRSDGNDMLQLADFSTLDKQNQTRAIAWCQEWAQLNAKREQYIRSLQSCLQKQNACIVLWVPFFPPNVINSLPCSSWGLNEAPRHIPEQGRWCIAEYVPVHNPETKKLLNLLTAKAVYTWSSHSLRTKKADSLQSICSTHMGICAHHFTPNTYP